MSPRTAGGAGISRRSAEDSIAWEPAAAGLGLGAVIGVVTSIVVLFRIAIADGLGEEYAGAGFAAPFLGLFAGCVLGGLGGVILSMIISRTGRRLTPLLCLAALALPAALVGLLLGLSTTGAWWGYALLLAVPATAYALLLPWATQRFRARR